MDASVLQAIARWPNVPAVAGWLSLDRAGRWRLHPKGDARQGGAGDPITNPGILAFIGRNYDRDEQGRWFFQNGPQRVFVRLDAAPFILRTGADGVSLHTHTGLSVNQVSAWWLDQADQLYASTDAGPGMVEGRDVATLFEAMRLEDGGDALAAAAALQPGAALRVRHPAAHDVVLLRRVLAAELETGLGFIANPAADVPEGP